MSLKRLLLVALVGLVVLTVVGLLVRGGWAVRSSWTQGFVMGRLAGEGGGEGIAPLERYRPGVPGMWLGFVPVLCGVGLMLTIGLFLLPLAAIGVCFRHRLWRTRGGPDGDRWAKHWHWPRGRMPPWCKEWAEPDEEAGRPEQPR